MSAPKTAGGTSRMGGKLVYRHGPSRISDRGDRCKLRLTEVDDLDLANAARLRCLLRDRLIVFGQLINQIAGRARRESA